MTHSDQEKQDFVPKEFEQQLKQLSIKSYNQSPSDAHEKIAYMTRFVYDF